MFLETSNQFLNKLGLLVILTWKQTLRSTQTLIQRGKNQPYWRPIDQIGESVPGPDTRGQRRIVNQTENQETPDAGCQPFSQASPVCGKVVWVTMKKNEATVCSCVCGVSAVSDLLIFFTVKCSLKLLLFIIFEGWKFLVLEQKWQLLIFKK